MAKDSEKVEKGARNRKKTNEVESKQEKPAEEENDDKKEKAKAS